MTTEIKPTAPADVKAKGLVCNDLLGSVENLVKQKGSLHISHDEGGGGMGYYWQVSAGGWPYCSGSSLEGALKDFVATHQRLEREALQKRINEIDASASL